MVKTTAGHLHWGRIASACSAHRRNDFVDGHQLNRKTQPKHTTMKLKNCYAAFSIAALVITCLALSVAFSGSVSAATLYVLDFNTLGPGGAGGIAFSNSGSGTTPVATTGGYNKTTMPPPKTAAPILTVRTAAPSESKTTPASVRIPPTGSPLS